MIAFRKLHHSISRSRFWREDIKWYGVGAQPDTGFYSHSLAYYLSGSSFKDNDIYVMINAYHDDLDFVIQQAGSWKLAVDTYLESPNDIAAFGAETLLTDLNYRVKARSIVVLIK